MFVAIDLKTHTVVLNLDHVVEINCNVTDNTLVFYPDNQSSTWNYTFVDGNALTDAYNCIMDGLYNDTKLIMIKDGLL